MLNLTMRTAIRKLTTTLATLTASSALVVSMGTASQAGTTGTTPASPDRLPSGIEQLSPYIPQISCDPTSKPGAVALGDLLRATYTSTSYSVGRGCGADGMASEHYEGRAVDWFVSARSRSDAAAALRLLNWMFTTDASGTRFANARRLGIMYIIWNDRIWGSYNTEAGWRPYSNCASHPEPSADTRCHRDHVHISLSWSGAMKRTSFWTGQVAGTNYGPCRPSDLNWAAPYRTARSTPCPNYPTQPAPAGASKTLSALMRYSGATVSTGSTGPVVAAIQRALGVGADGEFGSMTAGAVSHFRTSHGLTAGSKVDHATWRALLRAHTTATSTANPTQPWRTSTVKYGTTSPAVAVVQMILKVQPTSGWFGPITQQAVRNFQQTKGLPVTGVVDPATWTKLAASS